MEKETARFFFIFIFLQEALVFFILLYFIFSLESKTQF